MPTGVKTGTDYVKKKFIERKIKELTDGYQVSDAIFMRDPSDTPSVTYEEASNGLNQDHSSDDVEGRTEEGQYPRIGFDDQTKQALIKDYGLEVLVTYEAIRFNRVASINRSYIRLANSMVKYVDGKGLSTLTDGYNASTSRLNNLVAGTAFSDTANSDPFGVVYSAGSKVEENGYVPNVAVFNPQDWANAINNKDFRKEIDTDVPPERKIVRSGLLKGQVAGHTIVVSREMQQGFAWVGQDQVIGNRSETSNGTEIDTYKPNNSTKAPTVVQGFREFEDYLTDPKAGTVVSGL